MTPPKRPSGVYEDENGRMVNWRPIPDPTILTTQQLLRELASLREVLTTRMDGYDKAISLLQAYADRQPSIAEVVAETKEKFTGVQMQLHERDIRFDRAANDTKVAVDAAFAAAKEAVAKSEANVTKQIDALGMLLQANAKATDEKIDDLKTRIAAIEGRGQAYSSGFGFIATGIGILAAVAGAVAAVFLRGG